MTVSIVVVNPSVWSMGNLQFYGLVPHDDVSRQNEGLDVDDVCVSALCPHVQPFTLKGKVAKRDPAERETKEERDGALVCEQSQRIVLAVHVSGSTVYSHTFVYIHIDPCLLQFTSLNIVHNSAYRQALCISNCQ